MEKHLGWMRDLRGEKPPTAVHTPRIPTDTGSETDAVEEATVKVDGVDEGADALDLREDSEPPHSAHLRQD